MIQKNAPSETTFILQRQVEIAQFDTYQENSSLSPSRLVQRNITLRSTFAPVHRTGVVFHGRTQQVKYAINFPSYIFIIFSGFMGAMSGNLFYKKFILRKNPPNPLRDPDDQPPEKHPHTPEDD
ncbi:conserved Plasmodium protein, unknown function [Plasmodium ovale curtisi]|uniref:Uncharacterized protein n=1 Tax=Plasmodium ovale curtisi TaxID=864141 RepID=A0A1A8VQA3_PLAOA|nr:conserved Plasmodium protein, unknown function [Plasmodium ovale curtisi]SBS87309.1 conserved Plasmodium protein, unknown function [Plasmodium ovale curtisi]